MNLKNLNRIKFKTFVFGMCSEDQITNLIEAAENEGCILVQIIAGMMPAPQSNLAIPGTRPQMVAIMKIIVKIEATEYEGLFKRLMTQEKRIVTDD